MKKTILLCCILPTLYSTAAFGQSPYEKMRQRREEILKEREQKKEERRQKKQQGQQSQLPKEKRWEYNVNPDIKTVWIKDFMTDTITTLTIDDTSFNQYRICFRLPPQLENTEEQLSVSYNNETVEPYYIREREGTFYGKIVRKDKPYQYFNVAVKDKNGRTIEKSVVVKNTVIKVPDLPLFSLPAPIPSASYVLPDEYWTKCITYKDLDAKVRNALGQCKYNGLGYFYTPGGFSVATEVEQFDETTGKSKPEPARWSGHVSYMQQEGNVFVKAFKSLFLPVKGYYRIIVFVFSNENILSQTSPAAPSYEDAKKWPRVNMYSQLPAEIGNMKILPGVKCVTLIYEYYQEDGNSKPRFKNPTVLHNAMAHLKGSGILPVINK